MEQQPPTRIGAPSRASAVAHRTGVSLQLDNPTTKEINMGLPEPESRLEPHALSHVLSEIASNYAPTDEDEIKGDLEEVGYRASEIDQIMSAWEKMWQCSTCGKPADRLWASLYEDGTLHSMHGDGFSPSCEGCGGVVFTDDHQAVVIAPLPFRAAWTSSAKPQAESPLRVATVDMATVDRVREQLNEFAANTMTQEELDRDIHRPVPLRIQRLIEEIDTYRIRFTERGRYEDACEAFVDAEDHIAVARELVKRLCNADAGAARMFVGTALATLAQEVASNTRGEIHQYTFDEILLDTLTDARNGAH